MALFNRKKNKNSEAVIERPAADIAAEVLRPTVTATQRTEQLRPEDGADALAYQAIVRPHLTEKASRAGAFNKYVFRVAKGANKLEIKQAIQKLYKVHVEKVAVAYLPAKERRLGRQVGHKPGFKKAVVTLRAGNKIDLAA